MSKQKGNQGYKGKKRLTLAFARQHKNFHIRKFVGRYMNVYVLQLSTVIGDYSRVHFMVLKQQNHGILGLYIKLLISVSSMCVVQVDSETSHKGFTPLNSI